MNWPEDLNALLHPLLEPFAATPGVSVIAVTALLVGLFGNAYLARQLHHSRRQALETWQKLSQVATHAQRQSAQALQETHQQSTRIGKEILRYAARVTREVGKLEVLEKHLKGVEVIHEIRVVVLELKFEISLMYNRMDFALNFGPEKVRVRCRKYVEQIERIEQEYDERHLRRLYRTVEELSEKSTPVDFDAQLPGLCKFHEQAQQNLENLRKLSRKIAMEMERFNANLDNL